MDQTRSLADGPEATLHEAGPLGRSVGLKVAESEMAAGSNLSTTGLLPAGAPSSEHSA